MFYNLYRSLEWGLGGRIQIPQAIKQIIKHADYLADILGLWQSQMADDDEDDICRIDNKWMFNKRRLMIDSTGSDTTHLKCREGRRRRRRLYILSVLVSTCHQFLLSIDCLAIFCAMSICEPLISFKCSSAAWIICSLWCSLSCDIFYDFLL